MKAYSTPTIAEYGNVSSLTGIFGSSAIQDTFTGPNGEIVSQETGSIDVCAHTSGTCL